MIAGHYLPRHCHVLYIFLATVTSESAIIIISAAPHELQKKTWVI